MVSSSSAWRVDRALALYVALSKWTPESARPALHVHDSMAWCPLRGFVAESNATDVQELCSSAVPRHPTQAPLRWSPVASPAVPAERGCTLVRLDGGINSLIGIAGRALHQVLRATQTAPATAATAIPPSTAKPTGLLRVLLMPALLLAMMGMAGDGGGGGKGHGASKRKPFTAAATALSAALPVYWSTG